MSKFEFDTIFDVVRKLDLRDLGVIIGGQALNFLCGQFASSSELESFGALASKDLDYQTTDADIARRTKELGLYLERPDPSTRTELIGVVRIPVASGELCRVDFLRKPWGLDAKTVDQFKLKFDLDSGPVYIMHPLHCLQSRTKNVAALPDQYANKTGLDQLRAAIAMLRGFIRSPAVGDTEQVTKICSNVNQFCHQDCSLEVYRDHRIDVFEAIPIDMLPQTVLEKGYPHWVRQLGDRREKFAKAPKRIY